MSLKLTIKKKLPFFSRNISLATFFFPFIQYGKEGDYVEMSGLFALKKVMKLKMSVLKSVYSSSLYLVFFITLYTVRTDICQLSVFILPNEFCMNSVSILYAVRSLSGRPYNPAGCCC